MSQPSSYYYHHRSGNPKAAIHYRPILYHQQQQPYMTTSSSPLSSSPHDDDVIERDSRCYHPPLARSPSQNHTPHSHWGSRDEERDMKRTPTTPKSPPNEDPPGRQIKPLDPCSSGGGVMGESFVPPSSAATTTTITARGPHLIQSMGSGGGSQRSSSSSSFSSLSSSTRTSMSSDQLLGVIAQPPPPHIRMGGAHGGGMYDGRTGINPAYYASGIDPSRSRLEASQSDPRVTYYQPHGVAVLGQQSTLRHGDNVPRTGGGGGYWNQQQQAPIHSTGAGMGQGTAASGAGSKYRSRVQSTGSMNQYSTPSQYHSMTHGYSSLGDRPSGHYPTQSYAQPYKQASGTFRHYAPTTSYARHPYTTTYNAPRDPYVPEKPHYAHNTEEHDPYQEPYSYYHTEPQPLSLSASTVSTRVQNYPECVTPELGGQPIEHVSSEFSSKLSLQEEKPKSIGDRLEITDHPKDTKVAVKQEAKLSCKASVLDSQEEPNFLWYKDTEPLVGEIDSDYVVEEATEKDEGVYYCLVSHPQDDKVQKPSKTAKLTVKAKDSPEILQQPSQDRVAVVGEKFQLVLKMSGEPPLRYKWYKDTKEMFYAKTAVLEFPAIGLTDSGAYCCTVSNEHGSVLSNTFNVTVRPTSTRPNAPQQLQKPRPTSLHSWEDQPFTDVFLHEVGVTVAQQTRDLNRIALYLGLSNTDVVEIKVHFHRPDEQAFQILRKWSQNKRESRRLLRTILTQAGINLDLMMTTGGKQTQPVYNAPKPRILVHPQSRKVIYGNSFELSVQVENSRYLEYQWYKHHKPLSGKINPLFYVNSAVDSDTGDYYCVVKNQGGSVTSNVATVEVVVPGGRPSLSTTAYPQRLSDKQWYSSDTSGSRVGSKLSSSNAPLIGRGLPSCDKAAGGQPLVAERKREQQLQQEQHSVHVKAELLPRILEHPQSQDVEAGDPLTLTCRAEHSQQQHQEERLLYLWFFNGLSLKDENRPQYFINCFTDEDEGVYACKVSNTHGHVTSNVAHVQMKFDSDSN